ncbi:snakin-2-like [Rhodamnia argentea]|uniref:Snakin-2-like n=1 Tax=Rhodamnia argentea TaxID=178133 RepID=A0ABM3H171_9MYRT|nr:snakin-2-like [Rhodamnia argentea]
MAVHKLFIASFLVSLLLLQLAEADQMTLVVGNAGDSSKLPKMDCSRACAARCQLSSRPRLCQRACGTCCARCNCVPPGTSGNLDVCPCYADMTNRGNQRKCP